MKRLHLLAVATALAASMFALLAMSGCAQQETYTPPELSPVVNTPALSEEGVLRVGVDTSNAPLAGTTSSSGKIVGIDVDVASALADQLGLKVEFVDVGNDAATALKDGKVDIVMGVNKATADGSFWVSDEYLPTSIALFAKDSTAKAPSSDSDATIAAQVSSTSAWAVTNQFESATLDTNNDIKSCFDALSSGSADYVAADAVKGLYSANREEVKTTIVALMQSLSGYGIGVLDSNNDLKQAVSDALSTITSNGVVGVIEMKWFGETLDLSSVSLTDSAQAAVASAASATEENKDADSETAEGEENADASSDAQQTDEGTTETENTEGVTVEGESDASASTTTEASTSEQAAA